MSGGLRRYAALLRGVSPMNCSMPQLKLCFETMGFQDVKTLLSSGNVVFSALPQVEAGLAFATEQAMHRHLGRTFPTIVRTQDHLRELIETEPYLAFDVPRNAKRVVTFLRKPASKQPALPVELDGASILCMSETEVFTAYTQSPRGPVFMSLIEKTFGSEVTTRTWETVQKLAVA
jgi:uncharacterized protein (DUF1697 family)